MSDQDEIVRRKAKRIAAEFTSSRIARLASKAMRDPDSLGQEEIRSLGACALTQVMDKRRSGSTGSGVMLRAGGGYQPDPGEGPGLPPKTGSGVKRRP